MIWFDFTPNLIHKAIDNNLIKHNNGFCLMQNDL